MDAEIAALEQRLNKKPTTQIRHDAGITYREDPISLNLFKNLCFVIKPSESIKT